MNGRPADVYQFPGGDNRPRRDDYRQPEKIEPFEVFYPAATIEEPPPPEWLVDGIVMRRTVCLLAGAPKAGKSLVVQQLLTSAALGVPWLGYDVIGVPAFGLFTEDPVEEIEKRQREICEHYGVDRWELGTDLCLSSGVMRNDCTLVRFRGRSDVPEFTQLWHDMWKHVEENGIGLVFIDPAVVIFGGDINHPRQVSVFVRELARRAIRHNCSIIMAAHPSKADPKGFGGTAQWLAAVRVGLNFAFHEDFNPDTGDHANERVFRGLGANYGPQRIFQRLLYHDGVFIPADEDNAARFHKLTPQELEYRLLEGCKRTMENGGRIVADELNRDSLANRARRSRDPQIDRVSLNRLYQAQRELLRAGRLVRVEIDKKCYLRPEDGPTYLGESPWNAGYANAADD